MPRFMGGFSNSKSWTNQAREPRCNPSRSEMTLTEAAAETRKNNKALKNARGQLTKAEDDGNRGAAAAARKNIAKIEKRARGRG